VSRRWKLALALAGIVTLVSGLHYVGAASVWIETGKMTIIHRYIGWALTLPLLVVTLYFYARAVAHVPVGIFWRTLVAAIVMVLARYMGEAGLMHPALGFLIALALWLYILGEAYFGAMSEKMAAHGSDTARRGYFWLRLIMTIGWAILSAVLLHRDLLGQRRASRPARHLQPRRLHQPDRLRPDHPGGRHAGRHEPEGLTVAAPSRRD